MRHVENAVVGNAHFYIAVLCNVSAARIQSPGGQIKPYG